MHAVGTRDVEPEPAFFDPTGAGSGLSLKRAFLTEESTYLESM